MKATHVDSQRRPVLSDNLLQETIVSLQGEIWGTDIPMLNQEPVRITINRAQSWLIASPKPHQNHIFGSHGKTTVGLYIGSKIQRAGAAQSVAEQVSKYTAGKTIASQMALQHCGSNADYTFGMVINVNGDLSRVHHFVVRTWNDGQCFGGFDNETPFSELSVSMAPTMKASGLVLKDARSADTYRLESQATTCNYIQVVSGDSCVFPVEKCGITAEELAKYSLGPNLCSALAVGQYICCSEGALEDFPPKTNPDSTCCIHIPSAIWG